MQRLRDFNRWIFTPRHEYEDASNKQQARALSVFCVVAFAITTFMMIAFMIFTILSAGAGNIELRLSMASMVISWVGSIFGYALVQVGHIRTAGRTMILSLYLTTTLFVALTGVDQGSILLYSIVVVMASVLMSGRRLVMWAVVCTFSILLLHSLQETERIVVLVPLLNPIGIGAFALLVDAVILWYFSASRVASLSEAQSAGRRLRTAAQVSQTAIATLDMDDMLDKVVYQIREQFELYHAQIFLIDDEDAYAVLKASTGETGQILLDRGHRLAVGSKSMIGQVTAEGIHILASDTSTDAIHQRNEFLPDTRTELTVPLQMGTRVIGALDLQSRYPNAFSANDIEVFQVMSNQLAAAIENVRLFAGQRERAAESEALLRETETSLQEIKRLNRQLTRQAWDEYLQAGGREVLGITLQGGQSRIDTAWTPGMTLAVQKQRPVLSGQGERQVMTMPIFEGGVVIGAVEVEGNIDVRVDDALEVTQTVADRLAVAIDNLRLVEDSQRLADRELQVGQIAAKLQGQTTVDEMLATAVSELGRLLGAEQASIRLGLREAGTMILGDDEPPQDHGNGHAVES